MLSVATHGASVMPLLFAASAPSAAFAQSGSTSPASALTHYLASRQRGQKIGQAKTDCRVFSTLDDANPPSNSLTGALHERVGFVCTATDVIRPPGAHGDQERAHRS